MLKYVFADTYDCGQLITSTDWHTHLEMIDDCKKNSDFIPSRKEKSGGCRKFSRNQQKRIDKMFLPGYHIYALANANAFASQSVSVCKLLVWIRWSIWICPQRKQVRNISFSASKQRTKSLTLFCSPLAAMPVSPLPLSPGGGAAAPFPSRTAATTSTISWQKQSL